MTTERDPKTDPMYGDVLEIYGVPRTVVTTHDDTVVFLSGNGAVEHYWGLETWRRLASSATVVKKGGEG